MADSPAAAQKGKGLGDHTPHVQLTQHGSGRVACCWHSLLARGNPRRAIVVCDPGAACQHHVQLPAMLKLDSHILD